MDRTRETSPFYGPWVSDSAKVFDRALDSLQNRDIEQLGELSRLSYSRMRAALLACDPPVVYWHPATVTVIEACAHMRRQGIGARETIDAGPQVKILCLTADVPAILTSVHDALPEAEADDR